MFDLNAIVNAAITEAVNARITEVLAQHANIVGALTERITTLETNEQYLTQRIAVLEQSSSLDKMRLDATAESIAALGQRITTLENNPAQGVDTTAPQALDVPHEALLTALDQQEWFWSKMSDFIQREVDGLGLVSESRVEEMVQEAMDDHTSTYDHEDYDSHLGDDDKHFEGDIEDAVRDALSNMTFDVSIR